MLSPDSTASPFKLWGLLPANRQYRGISDPSDRLGWASYPILITVEPELFRFERLRVMDPAGHGLTAVTRLGPWFQLDSYSLAHIAPLV